MKPEGYLLLKCKENRNFAVRKEGKAYYKQKVWILVAGLEL
jgi:hypothetical protein